YRPKTLDLTSTLCLFSNKDVRSWGSNFKFFADVMDYNINSASQLVNTLVRKNGKSFDIIDAHDWLGIVGGMIVKKKLDIPLVFHVHSTEGGRSVGGGSLTIKNIEFEGGQFADCVITVSHAMSDELKKLGFPQDKIRVCWNGVDPNKYDPQRISFEERMNFRRRYGVNDNETLLFFIGRLVTVKGVDNLVRAMPSILGDFPNTKLVILGVGDMENQLRSLVGELGLKEKVILRTEFVSEEERILHYAAADVVVLPSLYEPFGIVCTEAMSMAKPVVVGARGTNGMREQIVSSGDEQCGIHINPFDPDDIAWGVKQILESKDRSILMGKKARERVIEQFSWDVVTDKTLEIYKEFVK
ncbi:MAG: glycosyltransferase family 4 protein, partial [Thermoplasmatales archaeon]|nr:glycosyltransferase family 4 protein [Thermoplasmatales archaeon]